MAALDLAFFYAQTYTFAFRLPNNRYRVWGPSADANSCRSMPQLASHWVPGTESRLSRRQLAQQVNDVRSNLTRWRRKSGLPLMIRATPGRDR